MFITSENVDWGTVKSLLHSDHPLAWKALWFIIDNWPEEDREQQLIPYVLSYLTERPTISQSCLVEYTSWFVNRVHRAFCLECSGNYKEAIIAYEECLRLKHDCVPVALALHRLKGRSKSLLEYCEDHPWDLITGYGDGNDFISSVRSLIQSKEQDFLGTINLDFIPTANKEGIENQEQLVEYICFLLLQHQMSLYPVTFEAIPFLIEILFAAPDANYACQIVLALIYYGLYSNGTKLVDHQFDQAERFYAGSVNSFKLEPNNNSCFYDFCLTPKEVDARYLMWGVEYGNVDDKAREKYRHEQIYAHIVTPTFFFDKELNSENDLGHLTWHKSFIIQAVGSGLPVYVDIYNKTASFKLKTLLHELIHLCGIDGKKLIREVLPS